MCSPLLTMILTIDQEKDAALTRRFFWSMNRLQAGNAQSVQFVAVVQSTNPGQQLRAICGSGLPVDIVHAQHPTPGGYPIWDVLQEARYIWPLVRGEYVTWQHPEFFWSDFRLHHTLNWLMDEQPVAALGNLMRQGTYAENRKVWTRPTEQPDSDLALCAAIDANESRRVCELIESMPRSWWCYWGPRPTLEETVWREDIFFVRRDWIEATQILLSPPACPFVDIYDVMLHLNAELAKRKVKPAWQRMPRDVHEAIHLWHPRNYGYFTRDMGKWFITHASEFTGMSYANPLFWKKALESKAANDDTIKKSVQLARNGACGVTTRLTRYIGHNLARDGTHRMAVYNENRSPVCSFNATLSA